MFLWCVLLSFGWRAEETTNEQFLIVGVLFGTYTRNGPLDSGIIMAELQVVTHSDAWFHLTSAERG